jgi:hypothetical protein
VWLARNAIGTLRAVKIGWRKTFWSDHPFEREFRGIQKSEPISSETKAWWTFCTSAG